MRSHAHTVNGSGRGAPGKLESSGLLHVGGLRNISAADPNRRSAGRAWTAPCPRMMRFIPD